MTAELCSLVVLLCQTKCFAIVEISCENELVSAGREVWDHLGPDSCSGVAFNISSAPKHWPLALRPCNMARVA